MRRVGVVLVLVLVALVTVGAHASGRGGGGSKGGNRGGGSGGGSSLPGDFAVGMNIGQPLAYILGTSFSEDTMVVPIPVEVHGHIRSIYGIAATAQVLAYQEGDRLSLSEILLAAGPRFRLTGKKLDGLYVVPKVGLGYMVGVHPEDDEFKRLAFAFQPEVGFSFRLGNPGLFLAFGVGLQLRLKLVQRPTQVSWSRVGKVAVNYTPVLNITVAFGG